MQALRQLLRAQSANISNEGIAHLARTDCSHKAIRLNVPLIRPPFAVRS